MKKHFSLTQVSALLVTLLFVTTSNGQVKTDSRIEKEHPKLIKTIGDPKYGNVQCILQDKAGNFWFGTTENGLYKFDGKKFSRFFKSDGLNSNSISCFLEDKEGKIWIGTEAGLCVYNPAIAVKQGGKIFTQIEIPLPKNLPPNKNEIYSKSKCVFEIIQAKSGKLWFATINGVYIYDGKSFTPFTIDKDAGGFLNTNNNAEHILEDKAGNIWFGGRGTEGVYRYDGTSVINFKLKDLFQKGTKPRPQHWAWPQLQDKNGNIWFSNWGGVYRYDGKTFTTFSKREGLPGAVSKITEDKKGNLWFVGDGICRYDGKSFTCFIPKTGLAQPGVWSILEDKSGNFWVGTRETGLYLFDGKTFIPYSEYKHKP